MHIHLPRSSKSEYRADIDGLRSIAVLSVFLFHLQPELLPGGFLGVDIFFVISGYLITNIILRENHLHTFSFIHFYTRRVKRIFPALFVVLIFSACVAVILLPPETYSNFMASSRYAAGQLANFFFARKVGYFNEGFSGQPLLHTWSLGVEEQFYLFWPLLIVCCFWLFNRPKSTVIDKTHPLSVNTPVSSELLSDGEAASSESVQATNRKIATVMLLLSIVSFAVCYVLAEVSYNQAFYMFYTRAFEFCIGGFICLRIAPVPVTRGGNCLTGGLGLILLFYSFFFIKEEYLGVPFLQFGVLVPCVGAALIIHTNWHKGTFNRLLASKLPCTIGKISYSLYLYHWPVIIFWKLYYQKSQLGVNESLFIIFVSFVLSALSYLLVEQPARKTALPDRRVLVLALTVVLGFAAGFNTLEKHETAPWRITEYVTERAAPPEGYSSQCNKEKRDMIEFYKCSDSKKPNVPIIALAGDSHAPHFIYSTTEWAQKNGYDVKYNAFPACATLIGDIDFKSTFGDEHAANCKRSTARFKTEIVDDPLVEIILISQRFELFHTGIGYSNRTRFISFKDNEGKRITDYTRYYTEQLAHTVEIIKKKGKELIFLKQVPLFDGAMDCNWEPLMRKVLRDERICVYNTDFIQKWQQPSIDFINQFAASHDIEVLDPMPFFDTPLYKGNNLYLNKDHLNEFGKHFLIHHVVKALDKLVFGSAKILKGEQDEEK